MNKQISIVIPVLNEEVYIGKLLEHLLAKSSTQNISEIIVVDGGSKDNTQDIVKAFSTFNRNTTKEAYHYIDNNISQNSITEKQISKTKIKLINSEKGRAKQMNLGAKFSNGGILYFLHADSFPPKNFDKLILNEITKGNNAGCFRMQFESAHWWLQLASWLTKFSWRACRGGDQSQFIKKTLFNEIGGYDESYIIYEDNILINELFARKEFVVINEKIRTSARLYKKHGVWKLQYYFWSIYVKRWFGADANELYRYYKKKICTN
ncbi:TIGR04283 family arsenosugar biosynthesis glycosyltransferase [uncultured Algibacter sp.]|uniref:TIGR04283 family arsenosugar biosynthesis glycosyltransferase n=1 Tax=uncultured Algibacter sp. TaxID=298659 RepID=UPI00260163B5|nr:TIGR04283 family arsenosugar biosynthesis glycosyltransferase [uncultured Algibacter sp.]